MNYKVNTSLIFLILGILFFTSCSQPEPIITKTIEDSLDLTQSFVPISASVLVTGEEQLSRNIESVRVLPSHIVLKQNEQIAIQQLRAHWTKARAKSYLNRYRLFLIFCSEMFKYNQGRDWHVMHYLFQN